MYKYRECEFLNLDAECTHNKYKSNATRNLKSIVFLRAWKSPRILFLEKFS